MLTRDELRQDLTEFITNVLHAEVSQLVSKMDEVSANVARIKQNLSHNILFIHDTEEDEVPPGQLSGLQEHESHVFEDSPTNPRESLRNKIWRGGGGKKKEKEKLGGNKSLSEKLAQVSKKRESNGSPLPKTKKKSSKSSPDTSRSATTLWSKLKSKSKIFASSSDGEDAKTRTRTTSNGTTITNDEPAKGESSATFVSNGSPDALQPVSPANRQKNLSLTTERTKVGSIITNGTSRKESPSPEREKDSRGFGSAVTKSSRGYGSSATTSSAATSRGMNCAHGTSIQSWMPLTPIFPRSEDMNEGQHCEGQHWEEQPPNIPVGFDETTTTATGESSDARSRFLASLEAGAGMSQTHSEIGPLARHSRDSLETEFIQPALHMRNRRGYLAAQEAKEVERHKIHRMSLSSNNRMSIMMPFKADPVLPFDPQYSTESIAVNKSLSTRPGLFHRRLSIIVQSAEFDTLSAILIVLNAITLGVQADAGAHDRNGKESMFFIVVEQIFFTLFLTELIMRLAVQGVGFFYLHHWKWNLFDFGIVSMQVVEEITFLIALGSGVAIDQRNDEDGGNYSVLRIIRVLRLVRIVRLARVLHLIGELRTIIVGIFSSMHSLFWTLVLLFLVIYILAVYMTQSVSNHLAKFEGGWDFGPNEQKLHKFYGSVPLSILTLYQAITGGISWRDASDPLMHGISSWQAVVFSVYIGFSIFCLMNITTGVFVESALETAKNDRDIFLLHHAHELFARLDFNNSGTVTIDEFMDAIDSREMQLYFKAIDLDPDAARDLFVMMDMDGSGELDAAEFVDGCLRLRGPAKAIDLASFAYEHNLGKRHMRKHMKKILEHCDWIERHMMKKPKRSVVPDFHAEEITEEINTNDVEADNAKSSEFASGPPEVSEIPTPRDKPATLVEAFDADDFCDDVEDA